jgi:hypothetical protein
LKYQRDIKEWTLDFSISMVKLSAQLKKAKIDFDVVDQIRRSGTSVFWFEIIYKGYGYLTEEFKKCREELNQIEKVLTTIILKLKENAVTSK